MPRTRMARSEQRVDERRDRRALGQHDQAAEDHHHDHDRQQPELLALSHESPEFDDDGAHKAVLLIRTGYASIAAAAPTGRARSNSSWPPDPASFARNP